MGFRSPKRDIAIPAEPYEVEYNYFMYLCDRVGLNGFPGNREKMDRGREPYNKEVGRLNMLERMARSGDEVGRDDRFINRVTYFDLARKLYRTDFVWPVVMDHNRAEDGEQLRLWYAELNSYYSDYKILEGKRCSVLEMLIAFAERIERDVIGIDRDAPDKSECWFWLMLFNLGIGGMDCSDAYYTSETEFTLDNVLDIFLHRKYDFNGNGGLFPLKHAEKDQKEVELWYQMQAFFMENPQYFE